MRTMLELHNIPERSSIKMEEVRSITAGQERIQRALVDPTRTRGISGYQV